MVINTTPGALSNATRSNTSNTEADGDYGKTVFFWTKMVKLSLSRASSFEKYRFAVCVLFQKTNLAWQIRTNTGPVQLEQLAREMDQQHAYRAPRPRSNWTNPRKGKEYTPTRKYTCNKRRFMNIKNKRSNKKKAFFLKKNRRSTCVCACMSSLDHSSEAAS